MFKLSHDTGAVRARPPHRLPLHPPHALPAPRRSSLQNLSSRICGLGSKVSSSCLALRSSSTHAQLPQRRHARGPVATLHANPRPLDRPVLRPFFLTFWALMGHAEPADATGVSWRLDVHLALPLVLRNDLSYVRQPSDRAYALNRQRYIPPSPARALSDFGRRLQRAVPEDHRQLGHRKQDRASMLQSCMQLQIPTPSPLNLLMLPWFVLRGLNWHRLALQGAGRIPHQEPRWRPTPTRHPSSPSAPQQLMGGGAP